MNVSETLAGLLKLVQALHAIAPNRFYQKFQEANTAREMYAVALELGYAANCKELRDTGDQQVQSLCEEILLEVAKLDAAFRVKLSPHSPGQKLSWDNAVSKDPAAKYAFRHDGSLEISLLDADLAGSLLHVKRLWNHVCNFDGSWTNFMIKLEAEQVSDQARGGTGQRSEREVSAVAQWCACKIN